ncbi:MAG: helix-turn-helix transcriptional regulator [Methanobrevibacter sp.]|nr:helix-turn-helix transcriptional regulator [Methanobrevibacter sp.]
MITLGQKLKAIRTHYKLSIAEFAEKLGVNSRSYSSYEYDERKPPFELLFNLFTVCNVNLNWLIADDGDMFVIPEFEKSEEYLTQKVEEILKKNGLIK